MAWISEVASVWKSTMMASACSPSGQAAIAASTARNGSSIGSMNTRPCALITSTRWPLRPSKRLAPRPGVPGGMLIGPQQRRLARDVAQRVALVEGVVAQRHHVGAGGA